MCCLCLFFSFLSLLLPSCILLGESESHIVSIEIQDQVAVIVGNATKAPVMKSNLLLLVAASLSSVSQAEDVLGVYIFHRHGDRTAKAWKPVNFTALGAEEVYSSGAYYRSRYVESDSDYRVKGLSSDDVVLSQLEVTAPVDAVLQNSATVFLQGLYPPSDDTVEVLANGSKITGPLGGYQYIPVNSIETAASAKDSENSAWLQGNSGCGNAEVSSNNYFTSDEYRGVYSDSEDFYRSLLPVVNSTYDDDEATFKNAYTGMYE